MKRATFSFAIFHSTSLDLRIRPKSARHADGVRIDALSLASRD